MRNNRRKSSHYDQKLHNFLEKIKVAVFAWSSYGLILLIVLLGLSLFRNVSTIVSANNAIAATRQRLDNLQAENQRLADQVAQVESPSYKEIQGRNSLGLAKPGETVLILPEDEVLKRISPTDTTTKQQQLPLPNWQKWLKLFL